MGLIELGERKCMGRGGTIDNSQVLYTRRTSRAGWDRNTARSPSME